ncbi:Aspartate aminotransferase [uncultured Flavonifractor sp.]|uniref:pyridoxal phosphate-dependent aminotransferase n=1 Tax=Eubacteriales TaxID=186802 RepID=UPI0008231751|nr:pyridoxal phosphate-dependent aminotransferase [Lawsonibacter sp. OA9]MBS5589599.1 pyridoxal phosphate-dependent aminotransferase [Clostridiales bacterium]MCH1979683.1 pyridoxal phosphate-dependent aminotransferase [Lawsonibacter sp. OA9]SCI44143.1 Aspartate aminotransferase [uncultured Flavonifractor sp.]
MKELSKIALAVEPSTTMAIDAMFKQMKAEGQNVIGFGAGEPDFPTPDYIKEAGIQAIRNNETKYTPAAGTIELRKAVCQRLKEDCGVDYEYTQIAVSNGAKPCVYVALRALVNPGDEVILPAPYWVSYIELIRMVGGVPVVVEATEAENFKITPEKLAAAITPKTKCMILNNPSNPTGMMYSRQELEAISKVCVEQDIYVISDEIYYGLVYDGGQFVSLAALGEDIKERTLLINGVSKSYAMTGWRIGYVAAPAKIAKVIANFLSHSTGSPCSISQKASALALSASQDSIEEMRKAFEERRNYMVERMNQIEGVSCIKPEGAFYVMMNIEKLIGKELHGTVIKDSDDFGNLFLKYGKVAVVPGTGFAAPNFVRWSYATSMENIKEGLDRLERFLAGETI